MTPRLEIARLAHGAVTAVAPAALFFAVHASAAMPSENTLSFVADGTSDTIMFTESTVLSLCVDGVTLPTGVYRASSNTIRFGESSSLTVMGGFVGGRRPVTESAGGADAGVPGESGFCLHDVRPVPPGTVVGGTASTISLPEGTPIDVCASNVRRRTGPVAGGNNELEFGDAVPTSCHTKIRVSTPRESVPEPESWLLFLLGAAALGVAAVRRQRSG